MEEYGFGGFVLRWDDGGCPLIPGGLTGQFRCAGPPVSDCITLRARVEPLSPLLRSPCLRSGPVFDRYEGNDGTILVYHWGRLANAFAVLPQQIGPEGGTCCLFDPHMLRQVPMPFDWFLGVSGLHRALLLREAAIFHAAYMEYREEAILFAAPAQTGKSTQAALWQRHAGAEIINGDRVLLRRLEGRWHACGFPCGGSSGICRNRNLPLRAVVILAQGPVDQVEGLSLSRQQTALVSGMQVYPWDTEELDRAFGLAQHIAAEVPVFRLTCTPTPNAVDVLRQHLEVSGLV